MTLHRWITMGLLATLLAACGKDEVPGPGEAPSMAEIEAMTDEPDAAIRAGVQALKNNNLLAFLETVAPPDAIELMREEFEAQKQEGEITAEQRQQFAETMERLTRDDAVDQLMAEIEPQLAQMSAQIPMMMGFGQMMAQQAVQESAELSPEQKSAAQESVTATFTRLQGIDFGDPALARKAVEIVVDTARELDLETLDEMQALSFDEALAKGSQVLAGAKGVMEVYGLSLNDMLDSVDTEVIENSGDSAMVNVAFDLFGTPQSTETSMVKLDGRWYGAELMEALDEETAGDGSN